MNISPHPALIARDESLRLGVALVVHELYGHTYPYKHRHNARVTILSTWSSSSSRDGYLERDALAAALAHLTDTAQVRTSLAGTPPTSVARAAGLRYLLARMSPGGVTMAPTARVRAEERGAAALLMADGLLEVLPELVDEGTVEAWAAMVADWEREYTGMWVVDLLESGFDPYDCAPLGDGDYDGGDEDDLDRWHLA